MSVCVTAVKGLVVSSSRSLSSDTSNPHTCNLFIFHLNYRLQTLKICFCLLMLVLLAEAVHGHFCLGGISSSSQAEVNLALEQSSSHGFTLPLIWRQIQLWEA